MKKDPIIAVAQIKLFDIHKEHNLVKIKKYIRLAKKANADIICFPESCLHRSRRLHLNHRIIKEIQEECKKNSIWCIVNNEIIINDKPYDLAVLINREGKIAGTSKKINLQGDGPLVVPGKKVKVFKTDFAKIGIIICWDLSFPDLFRKLMKAGAEIVFCPAAWCYEETTYDKNHKKEEIALLRSLVRARAFENLYFVALSNPIEEREDQVSYSAISSPHKILKEIIDKEGLIVAKLNLKEIGKLRKLYKKD